MRFENVDPTTGRTARVVVGHTDAQVEERLERAAAAQADWSGRPVLERAKVVGALAEVLDETGDELAVRMAETMGKPVSQGVAEARKCASLCRFYETFGPGWLADEAVAVGEQASARVRNDPLGLVLAVLPWNYPYWQAARILVPALLAGNGVLLKHAPATSVVAMDLERMMLQAGAPVGLVSSLIIDNEAVAGIIDDSRVSAVSLTGSTKAGVAVGRAAGASLKPHVLELGGSDAFVVLRDADVVRAAREGAASRMQNAGQSCIAAKRFIVEQPVADRFIAALRAELQAYIPGDPRDAETNLGPLARQDLRAALQRQVRDSVEAGAQCVLGGQIPRGEGWYYPPTLLTHVGPGQPAWDEEVFGPVTAVRVVPDAAAALAAANDSHFGLGASVWTRDPEQIRRFEVGIRAGAVFFNAMTRSHERLPFGGIGRSGHGRELGRDGLMSFVNRKAVWVDAGG